MPKLPRLKPQEAEAMLLKAGFEMIRSKGNKRVIVPYHTGKILHPKIIKQVLKSIESVG